MGKSLAQYKLLKQQSKIFTYRAAGEEVREKEKHKYDMWPKKEKKADPLDVHIHTQMSKILTLNVE